MLSNIADCSSFQQQQWHILWYNIPSTTGRNVAVALTALLCTIVFKKNGPTRGGYKRKFLREVHNSKLNAFESNAMLRCLFRLIL